MNREIQKYIAIYPGTPRGRNCSVHFGKQYRVNKAKEQASMLATPVERVNTFVNDFLELAKMPRIENSKMEISDKQINYNKIKEKYHTNDIRDVVWLRFTRDGYLATVAVSNDVNFTMPKSEKEYDEIEKGRWKHTTASIITHQLGKQYDETFVLLFPLVNIPKGLTRHDIECGIGNYLIEKGVPILDFYSHNY